MYFSAIFVILSASGVYFGNAGPIKSKLKLSGALGAENDVCPPGVWTCSSGKRSEISKTSSDIPENTVKLSQTAEDACPPGVWTCSTGKRSEITQEEAIIAMTPIHKDEPERQDLENCFFGKLGL